MNYCINIFSFNTRGVANRTKRVVIFLWLKAKGQCILLFQECHSNANQKNIWKRDWDGEIFFFHVESNCRGVLSQFQTRCTQREQNARLNVTCLTSVLKYNTQPPC